MSCIHLNQNQFIYCLKAYETLYFNHKMCMRFSDHIENIENLFIDLILFNEKAYCERYEEYTNTEPTREMIKKNFNKKYKNFTDIFPIKTSEEIKTLSLQAYKFMQSIDYQCCDSSEYEKWNGKRFFKEVQNDFLQVLLNENGYNDAKWTY